MTKEEKYRQALEKIAALENVSEVRGFLEELDIPEHLVKEGGWVPIHPRINYLDTEDIEVCNCKQTLSSTTFANVTIG